MLLKLPSTDTKNTESLTVAIITKLFIYRRAAIYVWRYVHSCELTRPNRTDRRGLEKRSLFMLELVLSILNCCHVLSANLRLQITISFLTDRRGAQPSCLNRPSASIALGMIEVKRHQGNGCVFNLRLLRSSDRLPL